MRKSLTQGFSTFLRRRRAKQHFERRPSPGVPVVRPHTAPSLGGVGPDLLATAREEPAAALQRLQSRADGLDAA